jgi:hypothetical protein
MPRRKGQPAKLNPLRRKILVESHRAGLTRQLSAQRANVGESTLYQWLQKGHEDREKGVKPWPWDPKAENWVPHPGKGFSRETELLEAMERAEADGLTEALLGIRAAGKGGEAVAVEKTTTRNPDGSVTTVERTRLTQPDWKAMAWLAERRRPRDYGGVTRTEVSGPNGGPVQVGSLLDLINKAADEEEEELRKGEKK